MPSLRASHPSRPLHASFGLAFICLALTGCPESGNTQAPPAPAKPVAEKQFDNIVEDLTRIIGSSDPRQNRDRAMQGGGNTQWSESISHELLPPADDADNYRATVTVTRRYKLTMFTRPETPDGDAEDGSGAKSDSTSPAEDPTAEYDPLADAGAGGDKPSLSIPPITTRENEKVRTYYLEHQDGRWKLITETDPDTEKSIQAAFDYALKRQ